MGNPDYDSDSRIFWMGWYSGFVRPGLFQQRGIESHSVEENVLYSEDFNPHIPSLPSLSLRCWCILSMQVHLRAGRILKKDEDGRMGRRATYGDKGGGCACCRRLGGDRTLNSLDSRHLSECAQRS
jgi:hypothetical protein